MYVVFRYIVPKNTKIFSYDQKNAPKAILQGNNEYLFRQMNLNSSKFTFHKSINLFMHIFANYNIMPIMFSISPCSV